MTRINEEFFKKCPNLPIDIAVMEKTTKGVVLPLDADWSDIGSWKSVWENSNKDKDGNFDKDAMTKFMDKVYIENVWCFSKNKNRDIFKHTRPATLEAFL